MIAHAAESKGVNAFRDAPDLACKRPGSVQSGASAQTRSVGHAWESRRGRVTCGVKVLNMAPRKAASGIETKEVLSAVVLADSFTQVRRGRF